jgi:hypothetical protein
LDVPGLVRARGVDCPEQLTKDEAREILDWCLAANRHAVEYPEEFSGCVGPGFGNLSREYKLYINSDEWKAKCAEFIKRAGGKCQQCRRGSALDVHHRHYESFGDEEFADVRVLCRNCHKAADIKQRNLRRWEAYRDAALESDPEIDVDKLREKFLGNR